MTAETRRRIRHRGPRARRELGKFGSGIRDPSQEEELDTENEEHAENWENSDLGFAILHFVLCVLCVLCVEKSGERR
jgi:hypothetical protein